MSLGQETETDKLWGGLGAEARRSLAIGLLTLEDGQAPRLHAGDPPARAWKAKGHSQSPPSCGLASRAGR